MAPTPNAIDLTTLANVQNWLGSTSQNSTEQQVMQDCITAASLYWLHYTGLGPQGLTNPTASPLNSVVTFSEVYDGSGSARLFLRNRPIVSVTSLTIGLIPIAASTGVNVPGYVIDGSQKSISLRGGFGAPAPGQLLRVGFWNARGHYRGFGDDIQSVAITYTAGYAATPFDVELAVREQVATNYKRRQWIDQRSQAMAQGAGTVMYQSWELSPSVRSVLDRYRRSSWA